MKTKIIGLAILAFVLSMCKENSSMNPVAPIKEITVKNNRIVFASQKVYAQKFEEFGKMSVGDLDQFSHQIGINSYYTFFSKMTRETVLTDVEKEAFEFSPIFKVILNRNGEFMIADTIVWFNNGIIHYIPAHDELLLATIKRDPSFSKIKGSYYVSKAPSKVIGDQIAETSGKDIYNYPADGKYQKIFNLEDDPNSRRKDVFEVLGMATKNILSGRYDWSATLYINFKLEWWSGNSHWEEAQGGPLDGRYTAWDFTVDARLTNVHANTNCTNGYYPYSDGSYYGVSKDSYANTNVNTQMSLVSFSGTQYNCNNGGNPQWDFIIDGTIYQYCTLDTDPSNTFYVPDSSLNPGILW